MKPSLSVNGYTHVRSISLLLTAVAVSTGAFTGGGGGGAPHVLNLNEPTRVCQLNVPSAGMYSVVYQNVQSSAGSMRIAL